MTFRGHPTSFPGSFPWLGGGAGKALFPPHRQAKEKTLGTRLEVILVPLSGTETMGEMLIYGVKGVRIY